MGIEPTHKGFADLSLTTWVPRLNLPSIAKFFKLCQRRACMPVSSLIFPALLASLLRERNSYCL